MEKFILLFRGGDEHKPGQSPEALQALVQKMMSWIGGLAAKGQHVGGEPLQRTGKQVSGTNKTVTDGPFVEAKEIIGGYTIVLAKDINEAVELAKACPILDSNGSVEVRLLQKMEM
jgi:hypothetical protein